MTLAVVLFNIALQWLFPNNWEIILLSQYNIIAILFTYILNLLRNDRLLIRSLFALLALDSWCDVIKFGLWQFSDYAIDLSLLGLICFIAWFIFVLCRQYPYRLDLVNLENVNILILKPKTSFDVLKGLIGLPTASICLLVHGDIWGFRRKLGIFDVMEYHQEWTKSHLVIDTKIRCNSEIANLLVNLLGKKRFPCIRCVWIIRHVLNAIGGKYAIKSWFDYIPGLYFMRII